MASQHILIGTRALPVLPVTVSEKSLAEGQIWVRSAPVNLHRPINPIALLTPVGLELIQGLGTTTDLHTHDRNVQLFIVDTRDDIDAENALRTCAQQGIFLPDNATAQQHSRSTSPRNDGRVPTATTIVKSLQSNRQLQDTLTWMANEPLQGLRREDWIQLLDQAFMSGRQSRQSLSKHAENCRQHFQKPTYKPSMGRHKPEVDERTEMHASNDAEAANWLKAAGVLK